MKSCGPVFLLYLSAITVSSQTLTETEDRITLNVAQGILASDNPDLLADGDSDLRSETRLEFGLRQQTQIDTLSVQLGTTFDASLRDTTTDFIDPFLSLEFQRDVEFANFGAALDYREIELDGTQADSIDLNAPAFDVTDQGNRTSTRLGVFGAFGLGGPLELSYDLSQRRLRFKGTTDTSLIDSDLTKVSLSVATPTDRQVTGSLTFEYSKDDQIGSGAIDTEIARFGPNVTYRINDTTEANAGLRYSELTRTGDINDTQKGLDYSFNVTHERPRATLNLGFASAVSENGRSDSVDFEHKIALPRGEVSYVLGLSKTGDLETTPVYGLNYMHEMPLASLSLRLDQSIAVDIDDNEKLNSRLTIDYQQELTSVSSMSLRLSYVTSDAQSSTDPDAEQLNLTAEYNKTLTQDWVLIGEISLVRSNESGTAERKSNNLFLGLQKQFAWR